jgi:hypothetical protein
MTPRRSAAVYEFPDRLIVIADHLTEAGFWRAGLPVLSSLRLRMMLSVKQCGAH